MRATEHEPPETIPSELESAGGEEKRETTALERARADDAVTEASEESFPASDAPPWTSSAT